MRAWIEMEVNTMTRDEAGQLINSNRPVCAGDRGSRHGKLYLANHKGDETLAVFEPGNETSCQVAQDKLTEFLAACVTKFGSEPPVWAKRFGKAEFDRFNPKSDRVAQVDEVFLQYPLVGG